MKYVYIFCFLLIYSVSKSQVGQSGEVRGQAVDDSKAVEYLIEDTKVAHFSYSNFLQSSDIEVNIYVSKGMPDIYGKPVFTIEFSGYSVILGNRTEIEGDIYEDEIGKAIHALQYINDTLVVVKPSKKINYFLNLGESQFSIGATYDPDSKKEGWKIALYLDRRNVDTYTAYVEPKDLGDLIKALEMARDEIEAEK